MTKPSAPFGRNPSPALRVAYLSAPGGENCGIVPHSRDDTYGDNSEWMDYFGFRGNDRSGVGEVDGGTTPAALLCYESSALRHTSCITIMAAAAGLPAGEAIGCVRTILARQDTWLLVVQLASGGGEYCISTGVPTFIA